VKECVLVSCCYNHCGVVPTETVTFPSIPRVKLYVNKQKLKNPENVKMRVALACSAMDLLVGTYMKQGTPPAARKRKPSQFVIVPSYDSS